MTENPRQCVQCGGYTEIEDWYCSHECHEESKKPNTKTYRCPDCFGSTVKFHDRVKPIAVGEWRDVGKCGSCHRKYFLKDLVEEQS